VKNDQCCKKENPNRSIVVNPLWRSLVWKQLWAKTNAGNQLWKKKERQTNFTKQQKTCPYEWTYMCRARPWPLLLCTITCWTACRPSPFHRLAWVRVSSYQRACWPPGGHLRVQDPQTNVASFFARGGSTARLHAVGVNSARLNTVVSGRLWRLVHGENEMKKKQKLSDQDANAGTNSSAAIYY
jgi:hypothetical protein